MSVGKRVKIFTSILIIITYKIFLEVEPQVSKYFTHNQLDHSDSGIISYRLYTGFIDNLGLLMVVLMALIYLPEIMNVIRKVKRTIQ